MSLWNVQIYDQGELISSDVIEETEIRPMTQHFERKGYDVRSEPAWKRVALHPQGRLTHSRLPSGRP